MAERPDDNGTRDRYYIRTSAAGSGIPRLVVKCEDAFFVSDHHGDFPELTESEFGFYVGGTRFLRALELAVHGHRPLHLNAAVSDDGRQVAVDLTNPDLREGDAVILKGRLVRLARRLVLAPSRLTHILTVESFSPEPHELVLTWHYLVDFADVFEVRGMVRERRGALLPPELRAGEVRLAYRGLDGVVRTTALAFDPPPERLASTFARHRFTMLPGEAVDLRLTVTAWEGDEAPAGVTRAATRTDPERAPSVRVVSASAALDEWVARAWADLRMLTTETPHGRIAYAGIPWFVAPFGRDSIITALQHLPFDPELGRGTLRFLAAYQGCLDDEFTDQKPGKILHEYRRGEMAACREIVFLPYYGSVDATPLFLILVTEYLRWTDDRALLAELEPAISAALGWIERSPYMTYASRSPQGLVNQGWKDSQDAIMNERGETPVGPIALVEVQGYKYAALNGAAEMADMLGRADAGRDLRASAVRLRERFLRDFWMDEEGFLALALDGTNAPCRVISSNPAHCLWTGLVPSDWAGRMAKRLLGRELFSGWGVRTLGTRERRYNPMSYHDGSVWPHDTAIAAAGLRRYGFIDEFLTLASGLFEAAQYCAGRRLPELFCGFPRVPGYGPTPYPVACSPQAWAAGVVSQLLGEMLGLEPEARENRLTFRRPVLPEWLPWVEVRGLRLKQSRVDVLVTRGRSGAGVEVLDREGDAEVVVRR
jgi:glycogen debranching enzyme